MRFPNAILHVGPAVSRPVLRAVAMAWLAMGVGSCAKQPTTPPFNAPANTSAVSTTSSDRSLAQSAEAPNTRPDQVGTATWYGKKFAGKKTSNGERFDPRAMTAAHRKLPFGTWVEVRRIDTGSTVRVRINDRGPFGDRHKIIDLSEAAASRLGVVHDGTARVEIRVVRGPE